MAYRPKVNGKFATKTWFDSVEDVNKWMKRSGISKCQLQQSNGKWKVHNI